MVQILRRKVGRKASQFGPGEQATAADANFQLDARAIKKRQRNFGCPCFPGSFPGDICSPTLSGRRNLGFQVSHPLFCLRVFVRVCVTKYCLTLGLLCTEYASL